jgi:hypothetical protein
VWSLFRRADAETKQHAVNLKAQIQGREQRNAADKAVAETFGGGDSKWAKWKDGGTGKVVKKKGLQSDVADEEGHNTAVAAPASDVQGTNKGGAARLQRQQAGDNTSLELQDILVAIERDPAYCNSTILYSLLQM